MDQFTGGEAAGWNGPGSADAVRLRVLGEFGILDSPAEQDFDDLTMRTVRAGFPERLW